MTAMKSLIFSAFALLFPVLSYGQNKAYEAGEKVLNVGISLGYYGYGYLGDRSGVGVPLNASLEYGFTDGISAGAYIGYARWSYRYNTGFGEAEYSWTFFTAGARGSFHYTRMLNELTGSDINEEKVDLYVSVLLGLEFRSYQDDENFDVYDNNDTVVQFGPNLGVRYLLGKNIGVYLEGGRGAFGWLNFGLTARF